MLQLKESPPDQPGPAVRIFICSKNGTSSAKEGGEPAGEETFVQKGFADANAAVSTDAFPQGQASILPFWLPAL